MSQAPCRKFTLLDAMILVAALAIGLGWARMLLLDHYYLFAKLSKIRDRLPGSMARSLWIEQALLLIEPCTVALTVGFLALRLRRPRPRLVRLLLQPGTVACTGALGGYVGVLLANLDAPRVPIMNGGLTMTVLFGSTSVVLMWAMLWLMGAWDAGRGWIEWGWVERLGVALGVCWVGESLAYLLSLFV